MQHDPLPNPPPQAGEGAHRTRFFPLPLAEEGAALIRARRVGASHFSNPMAADRHAPNDKSRRTP